MTRFSGKISIGLAIWLFCQNQGSAQEARYAPSPAPAAISNQLSAAENMPESEGDELADNEVEQATWLQQQPTLSTPGPQAQPSRRSTSGSRQANVGLASVPNMFGDLGGATSTFILQKGPSPVGGPSRSVGTFSLPIAGGGSRIGKISENDSPIPRDRIFFSYNHFQNVFQISETPLAPPGPTQIRQEPIDRYTLGFEKTFFEGWTSVEVRMPFTGSIDAQLPTFGYSSTGNVGNLTVVLKKLVYMDYSTAVGAGVAIETPTGTDTFSRIDGTRLQFRNDATHLLPYIGFNWSPGDPRWGWGSGLFFSGFAQIDINTNGNRIDVVDQNNMPRGTLGTLTDQNLGFLDLAAGYWLYRDPDAPRLTGLAAITELHYTTTLQDVDRINGTVAGNTIAINSTGNRFDILNGTIGVQALLFDASSLRVAGVFPMGNDDRRLFDSELQVQFNRRF
jgi:hypothetical protein